MIDEILTEWGRPYRESFFPARLPADTCAVYLDDITADGPDGVNRIFTHDTTVEVYEPKPDAEAEADFEAALNSRGIPWEKQARYWLTNLQRYQVIYTFSYITKT